MSKHGIHDWSFFTRLLVYAIFSWIKPNAYAIFSWIKPNAYAISSHLCHV
jgi:hypothetical protein